MLLSPGTGYVSSSTEKMLWGAWTTWTGLKRNLKQLFCKHWQQQSTLGLAFFGQSLHPTHAHTLVEILAMKRNLDQLHKCIAAILSQTQSQDNSEEVRISLEQLQSQFAPLLIPNVQTTAYPRRIHIGIVTTSAIEQNNMPYRKELKLWKKPHVSTTH